MVFRFVNKLGSYGVSLHPLVFVPNPMNSPRIMRPDILNSTITPPTVIWFSVWVQQESLAMETDNSRAVFAIRPRDVIPTYDSSMKVFSTFGLNAGSFEDIQRHLEVRHLRKGLDSTKLPMQIPFRAACERYATCDWGPNPTPETSST